MIKHVREWLAADRDSQFGQVREIGLAQLARPVFLREVHLLRRSLRRTPVFHLPLQRSQLAIGETLRIPPLQSGEDRLRFEARIRGQLLLYLRPHIRELIFVGAPVPVRLQFARQYSSPADTSAPS